MRAVDPVTGRLTIDFVVHDGGVAAAWAVATGPGEEIRLSRPRSWYRPPADTRWQLLVADLTGLPALARIMEEATDDITTRVLVEVIDEVDLAALPSAPGVTVESFVGCGNGVAPSVLADRVAAITGAEHGYVWFAGEAAEARRIRKQVRRRWGWSSQRLDVIGYWRRDAERWKVRYDRVADRLDGVYQEALDRGHTQKDAAELLDLAYEEAGL